MTVMMEDIDQLKANSSPKSKDESTKAIYQNRSKFARCTLVPQRHYMLLRVTLLHSSASHDENRNWIVSAASLHSLLYSSLCELHGLIGAASMPLSVISFINSADIKQRHKHKQFENNKEPKLSYPLCHASAKVDESRIAIQSTDSSAGLASLFEESVCAVVCCDATKLSAIRTAFMLYGRHSNAQTQNQGQSIHSSSAPLINPASVPCRILCDAHSAFLPTLLHACN